MPIPIPRDADEQWFTAYMLSLFHNQNLGAMHIKETDKPGATDILVWRSAEILGWVELKIGDKTIEVSQREFIRGRDDEAGNAYVFRLRKTQRYIECFQGLEATSLGKIYEPADMNWQNWFWKHRRDGVRYK